ncbi:MAG TPA: hypothetical protein VNI54_03110 [Thermoanaerobaculia bacterium]|nr:hypothetical protein [Thermoanaerobaculia bacterium]
MTIASIGRIGTDIVATIDALPAAGACRPASAAVRGLRSGKRRTGFSASIGGLKPAVPLLACD